MNVPSGDGRGMGEELRRLTDGVARLVREHVELAQAELRQEVRGVAADAAMACAALPFLLAALLLLDAALALGLAGWLGSAWAFALVGALNLGAGALLGGLAAARLRRRKALEATGEELRRDRLLLRQVAGARGGRRAVLPPPHVRPYAPAPEERRAALGRSPRT